MNGISSPVDLTRLSISAKSETPCSTSSITNASPRTFTLFSALPFEIRLKIYSYANNDPRTVAISYKSVVKRSNRGNRTIRNWRNPHSHTPSPSPSPSPSVTATSNTDQQGVVRSGNGNTDVNGGGQDHGGGGISGSGSGSGTGGTSGTSGWVSISPVPPLLHAGREARHEALKYYRLSFASLEAPASIYFNFDVDTLYFGGAGDEVQAPYRLDMFLGGDYYGCRDAEMVRFLAVDIPEEIYGRRAFCWEDVRGFAGVREVLLLIREEEDEVKRLEGRLGGVAGQTRKERLMAFYHKSLRRVWDAYVKGEGEGLTEGEWEVPEIRVWNSESGRSWGNVKLEIEEGGLP